MDISGEEELLSRPVIHSGVCGEHLVVLPGIYWGIESGQLQIRVERHIIRPHENGIHVHIHAADELERLDLGIVCSVRAFYDLPVLVPHRGSVLEYGHGVLGIVVQVSGPERVVVLVLQLHHASAELRPVLVHEVIQFVTAKDGLVLEDLYVAVRIDQGCVHVPDGGVAYKVCVIVKESGGAEDFADLLPLPLYNVH